MMYTFPMRDTKYVAIYYEKPTPPAGVPVFEVREAQSGCRLCCDNDGFWWETAEHRQIAPPPPSDLEIAQQDITDLQLADIERGQEITDLQIAMMEVSK